MWSSVATAVTVEVIDRRAPTHVHVAVAMQPTDRPGWWSVDVPASSVGTADLYGFRVDGPYELYGGPRGDHSKLLLDPEATQVWFPPHHDRDIARTLGTDTRGRAPLGVLRDDDGVTDLVAEPWTRPDKPLVIYEMHTRGATKLAHQVDPDERGTFAGIIDLVPHLRNLGVTAIELLPIHQFDPEEANYWGYNSLAWSALHHAYVAGDRPEAEFAAMIEACHQAGIAVYLDVVYNHTTEEDALGPTYSLRGIDNDAYYIVGDDGRYNNDAGCGNVVRAAHPAAQHLILHSLRRYVMLGVDGFRFDLASLLGRDNDGGVQHDSEFIDDLTRFAAQHGVEMIAEPWDIAAYQVGDGFPGRTWGQWNGRFRDDVRSFLRGEQGYASALAVRVAGSPDLYGAAAQRSINFITAHDGFTLYDLCSYEHKHNLANGWNNHDGTDDNRSWNCGWEGDDPPAAIAEEVRSLRLQQMRNAFAVLLLSRGTPMLLAGDEFANTQHGNNNAYNQDNEISWLDWGRAEQHSDLSTWVRSLIDLRAVAAAAGEDFSVHGVGATPDFGPNSHSLAWRWGDVYVMLNSWWEPLTFAVQAPGEWRMQLCSAAAEQTGNTVTVPARSVVVLRRGSNA